MVTDSNCHKLCEPTNKWPNIMVTVAKVEELLEHLKIIWRGDSSPLTNVLRKALNTLSREK